MALTGTRARSSELSVGDARACVLAATPRLGPEGVDLAAASGRVLADDVVATGDVPARACAAMDGYAVADAHALHHAIVGESRAGHPVVGRLRIGEAMRISTGAAIPPGTRAVVRVERTSEENGHLTLREAPGPGRNIRAAGEDLRAGATVLRAGTVLDAAALGVAAGAGRATLPCARRPRVALVCTGDELVAPGAPLGPGQIHNTNAIMLPALATACGAHVVWVRRVADDRGDTERAIAAALADADVVLTCGGISAGMHDHVRPALHAVGVAVRFSAVGVRPGRPTWFGSRDEQLVFGLPGNPVACMVAFSLFAATALRAAQGLPPQAPLSAALATSVARRPEREQALRVRLSVRGSILRATPAGSQRSHVSSAMLRADGLALIAAGSGHVPAGDLVPVERIPGRAC